MNARVAFTGACAFSHLCLFLYELGYSMELEENQKYFENEH